MTSTDWLTGWVRAVNADTENAHIGRFASFTAKLLARERGAVVLRYNHGTVSVVPDQNVACDIELRGSRAAWQELADPHAAPRRHDLLSLTKVPDGIEVAAGRDQLLRHLRVITRLTEIAKAHG